jgi:hypothetical protein
MAQMVLDQAKKDAEFFIDQDWDMPDPDVEPIVDLANMVIQKLQSLP